MTIPTQANSVLDAILEHNQDRNPERLHLKLKRMAGSAFAFFRGTCGLFARVWDDLKPPDVGPSILVCGDLHLENFGAFRDDAGVFLFDINDFDESVVAPCAIDPVRCATSILLAAELWELSPLHANRLVLAYLDEYRATVKTPAPLHSPDAVTPGAIREILGKTALGSQDVLLDHHTERLKNGARRIIRSKRMHPELEKTLFERVLSAVEAYGAAKGRLDFYRPLDATARIAGIGSLGQERYLVLVTGDGPTGTNRLLDIKEERPSSWEGFAGSRPLVPGESQAARVVHAQRALQAKPTAGLDVIPIDGAEFRVREMIPEENRSSLDRFQRKPGKLYQAIVEAGRLTGLAHLRGSSAVEGGNVTARLTEWAEGAALDSVLAAAARYAERTRLAYKSFRTARLEPRTSTDGSAGPVPRQGKKGRK